jgi:hypothetical protein
MTNKKIKKVFRTCIKNPVHLYLAPKYGCFCSRFKCGVTWGFLLFSTLFNTIVIAIVCILKHQMPDLCGILLFYADNITNNTELQALFNTISKLTESTSLCMNAKKMQMLLTNDKIPSQWSLVMNARTLLT